MKKVSSLKYKSASKMVACNLSLSPHVFFFDDPIYNYINAIKKQGYIDDVEIYIKCREDALFKSANNGHLEVVKHLIERGADIHAYNDLALKLSAENHHTGALNTVPPKSRSI